MTPPTNLPHRTRAATRADEGAFRGVRDWTPVYGPRGEIRAMVPEYAEALAGWYGSATPPARDHRRPTLDRGTRPVGGLYQIDHNRALDPYRWRGTPSQDAILRKMRYEDPVCAALTHAWTLPIRTTRWNVRPNGTDRRAYELARFVRESLTEHLQGGLFGLLEQAAPYVWWGAMLFEPIYRHDRAVGAAYGMGTPALVLDRMVPHLLWEVERWIPYQDGRWGLKQWAIYGDEDADAPAGASFRSGPGATVGPDEILHLRHNPEGYAPEGESILRPCYGGSVYRRLWLQLQGDGIARGAHGIPVVEVANASGLANPGDQAIIEDSLRDLRAGLRSWMSIPEGYTLKIVEIGVKIDEINLALDRLGQEMARAALAQHIYSGTNDAARASLESQHDAFAAALNVAAGGIAAAFNQGPYALGKQILNLNFPGVASYPYLEPTPIRLGSATALVQALATAAAAGLYTPDDDIAAHVRDALGLPEPMPPEPMEQWEHETRNGGVTPEIVAPPAPDGDAPSVIETGREEGGDAADAEQAAGARERAGAAGLAQALADTPRPYPEALTGAECVDYYGEVHTQEPIPSAVAYMERRSWRLVDVPLREVHVAARTRQEGDPDARRAAARPAFDPEQVPPVIAARGWGGLAHGRIGLLDGRNRVRRAIEAGLETIRGYMPAPAGPGAGERDEGPTALAEPEPAAMVDADVPTAGPEGRALADCERVVRLSETAGALDAGKAKGGTAIERWRHAVAEPYARALLAQDTLEAMLAVPVPGVDKLAGRLEEIGERAVEAGRAAVRGEIRRLKADPALRRRVREGEATVGEGGDIPVPERLAECGCGRAPQRVALADGDGLGELTIDEAKAVEQVAASTATVSAERIRQEALRLIEAQTLAGQDRPEDLLAQLVAFIRGLSPKKDQDEAGQDVGALFGIGRILEAKDQGAEEAIFSNILEPGWCEPCRDFNGRRLRGPDLLKFATPYSECKGGNRCRCLQIYVV